MTANPRSGAINPLRIAGLVSGGGRTLLNIQDCIHRGELAAEIAIAVCSRSKAPAISRLRDAGVDVRVVDRSATPSHATRRIN
jgi:folate-dependent phosphoribosylglycinamide formyltransferase PurN